VDPFVQLLNMQLDLPVDHSRAASADGGDWSVLGNPGLAGAGMDQLLTHTLLRLLERLIDGQPAPEAAPGGQAVPQGWPVAGRISQGARAGHQAVDIAVPVGTPVRATLDGRVVHAGWNTEGYGNLVIVENGAYRTYYAHLDSIPVTIGQTVKAGEVVGLSGNTGNSTGPHLHYEVRYNGQALAPDLHA
jgi:murein DD-endopeptidase MepM/ murein hydrolase activator NlpD